MFKDQQRFEAEIKAAPADALLGPVKVEEVAQEYAHAYVLTRTVSLVVADLSEAAPRLADVRQDRAEGQGRSCR